MFAVEQVPVDGPSVLGGILSMIGVAVAATVLMLAGLWPFAVALAVVGSAANHLHVHRAVRRRRAEAEAAGINPDYTAWEARIARRLGLSSVAVLMLTLVGLLVLAVVWR